MKKVGKGTIMVENEEIEAITPADLIEYKGKLYTPMERLSLLMEEVMKEGTKPNGIRQPGERCMYEIQRKINAEENKRRERIKMEDDR